MPEMKLTPLKQRIVDALKSEPGNRMAYHALAYKLWPQDQCPNAWNYSKNGGPCAWAMPLGRAIRELQKAGITYEGPSSSGNSHGDIVLLNDKKTKGV